mmetsp:Transcript_43694/g.76629  ORF Transcript_43694/g.76629 Transcript_43694/m.76629 type:complete len:97 (-) Transcript_43694:1920-2210(-)
MIDILGTQILKHLPGRQYLTLNWSGDKAAVTNAMLVAVCMVCQVSGLPQPVASSEGRAHSRSSEVVLAKLPATTESNQVWLALAPGCVAQARTRSH